jgi:hypothetical protein
LLPSLAHAHFTLQDPPNWTKEDGQGSPQKDWPCGNEPNASGVEPMDTGPTTAFKPGDKVTITIVETVMHPGHYRVALAPSGDMADLPQDMAASASGSMCQNDDMQATPAFPILADGMLEHTAKLTGPQSFEVTLPTDVTCDKCVLQVREYMAQHGNQPETMSGQKAGMNGCYYHHCAYISIGSGSGTGGMSGAGGASTGGAPGTGGVSAEGGAAGMSASMGGAMGQAGMSSANGGMPGASGATAAGSSGSGGTTGSGGTSTAGGTTSTGGSSTMLGTGGTANGGEPSGSGTGGSGIGLTTGNPAGTSSGSSEPASGDEQGGCSIGRASSHGSLPLRAAGLVALGLLLARRRRR